ncbi:hypothetical protein MRX96_009199 [Rhipicephalus microplus]
MDSARIMNAAPYLGLPPKNLLKGCDSVMICISKGLSCPVGSLVAGSKTSFTILYNGVDADYVDATLVKIRYVIEELCRSAGA